MRLVLFFICSCIDCNSRYTSLSSPDAATMVLLNALVNNIRQLIGPANLPVTDRLLRRRSDAYLPILHRVLTDLIPAAANNQQGTKLFTLLPQCSNQAAFVKITSSGLHRYSCHCKFRYIWQLMAFSVITSSAMCIAVVDFCLAIPT